MPARTRIQVPVCPVAELLPGKSRIVKTERGRSIAVFNVNGKFHAVGTICPHQGGPMEASKAIGTTRAKLTPDGFLPERVCEGEIFRCGWHLYEFEIATGKALVDESLRVATYPVQVVSERTADGKVAELIVVEV